MIHHLASVFMKHRAGVALLCLILFGSGCLQASTKEAVKEVEDEVQQDPCNGLIELCQRSFSDVTFPETHNGFPTHEDGI